MHHNGLREFDRVLHKAGRSHEHGRVEHAEMVERKTFPEHHVRSLLRCPRSVLRTRERALVQSCHDMYGTSCVW